MTTLIADIGATNARFAVVDNGIISSIDVLLCDAYPTISDAALAYINKMNVRPTRGVFALATPLDGSDRVGMTNHVWTFSIEETRQTIGLQSLKIINDFTAITYAIPALTSADYYQVGGGTAVAHMPIGIIGPGSGLGVSALVFADGKPIAITTEGGHVTMPAQNAREFALFEYLKQTKYHHISAERVASGKGILNLYQAIGGVDGLTLQTRTPAEITQEALNGACPVCAETLDLFCHFLGVAAGNLALSLGAAGGIYIAGGIVPQLGDYFVTSRFRQSFIEKGRFKDYLERIPTFVMTHPYLGLEGLKGL